MSSTNKSEFLVRFDLTDSIGVSCDEDTLKAWIHQGKMRPEHQIWDQQRSCWAMAKNHASVASFFSQSLWDAWEESSAFHVIHDLQQNAVDSDNASIDIQLIENSKQDQESGLSAGVKDEEELLSTSIATAQNVAEANENDSSEVSHPVEEASEEVSGLEAVELEILEAIEAIEDKEENRDEIDEKEEELIDLSDSAKILIGHMEMEAKPRPVMRPAQLSSYSPPPTAIPIPKRDFPQNDTSPKVIWWRVLAIVVPAAIVVILVQNYIIRTATTSYTFVENPTSESPKAAQKVNEFEALEADLRQYLPQRAQPISRKEPLEDALRVDLQRLKVQVLLVESPILRWTGRHRTEPKSTKISIRIQSSGELDRDFAAVALVTGKYIERYNLEAEKIQLDIQQEGQLLRKYLDVTATKKLYMQRVTLEEFLQQLTTSQ